MNRRKLLKATGATISTGPLFGVAGAREGTNGRSFEEHAAQARKIREKTGSQERFVEYHRRHADSLTNKQWKKKLPHHGAGNNESDGPSTETIDSGESVLDLTVGYYLQEGCGGEDQAHIDLHVNIDSEDGGDGGKDNFAVSWNENHYKYEEPTAYIDGCDYCSVRKEDFKGVSWDWGDGDACYFGCDLSFSLGCHAELKATEQERAIQAEHNHTWSHTGITGVSFTTGGGVKVNFSSTENWEQLEYRSVEEPFDTENFC